MEERQRRAAAAAAGRRKVHKAAHAIRATIRMHALAAETRAISRAEKAVLIRKLALEESAYALAVVWDLAMKECDLLAAERVAAEAAAAEAAMESDPKMRALFDKILTEPSLEGTTLVDMMRALTKARGHVGLAFLHLQRAHSEPRPAFISTVALPSARTEAETTAAKEAAAKKAAAQAAAAGATDAEAPLPEGWMQVKAPDGRTYYLIQGGGKPQFERPTESASASFGLSEGRIPFGSWPARGMTPLASLPPLPSTRRTQAWYNRQEQLHERLKAGRLLQEAAEQPSPLPAIADIQPQLWPSTTWAGYDSAKWMRGRHDGSNSAHGGLLGGSNAAGGATKLIDPTSFETPTAPKVAATSKASPRARIARQQAEYKGDTHQPKEATSLSPQLILPNLTPRSGMGAARTAMERQLAAYHEIYGQDQRVVHHHQRLKPNLVRPAPSAEATLQFTLLPPVNVLGSGAGGKGKGTSTKKAHAYFEAYV